MDIKCLQFLWKWHDWLVHTVGFEWQIVPSNWSNHREASSPDRCACPRDWLGARQRWTIEVVVNQIKKTSTDSHQRGTSEPIHLNIWKPVESLCTWFVSEQEASEVLWVSQRCGQTSAALWRVVLLRTGPTTVSEWRRRLFQPEGYCNNPVDHWRPVLTVIASPHVAARSWICRRLQHAETSIMSYLEYFRDPWQ